jgi:hypothetical protein
MTGGMHDTSLARSGGLWDKEGGLHVWFGTVYYATPCHPDFYNHIVKILKTHLSKDATVFVRI